MWWRFFFNSWGFVDFNQTTLFLLSFGTMFSFNVQVGDLDINYINIEGLSAHMSPESMRSTLGPQACRHIPPPDSSPSGHPLGEDSVGRASTAALQPCVSPASSCASQLNLPLGLHEFEKEQGHLKKRR